MARASAKMAPVTFAHSPTCNYRPEHIYNRTFEAYSVVWVVSLRSLQTQASKYVPDIFRLHMLNCALQALAAYWPVAYCTTVFTACSQQLVQMAVSNGSQHTAEAYLAVHVGKPRVDITLQPFLNRSEQTTRGGVVSIHHRLAAVGRVKLCIAAIYLHTGTRLLSCASAYTHSYLKVDKCNNAAQPLRLRQGSH